MKVKDNPFSLLIFYKRYELDSQYAQSKRLILLFIFIFALKRKLAAMSCFVISVPFVLFIFMHNHLDAENCKNESDLSPPNGRDNVNATNKLFKN